jgi:hypothetical protein
MLKEAKQKAARMIPRPRSNGFDISTPMAMPKAMGNTETMIPKEKEEKTSPRKIVHRETGEEMSLSRVLDLASHGTIAGPTEVAVKKVVMPSNPGIRSCTGVFLPI